MNKLYQKSELWFSLAWIFIYVIGSNIAGNIHHAVLLCFHAALSATALIWLKKNSLFLHYGLCSPVLPARSFLLYIPLAVAASSNLWFGIRFNMPPFETLSYIFSMLCVGFLEEIIFRGFLFKAMCKETGIRIAVIVSGVTFGIGHIVNLFNGSGADTLATLCQILYATAFGFLFVILFLRGKSLLPCIAAHSLINALSVFSNDAAMTNTMTLLFSLFLTALAVSYAFFLIKRLPKSAS